jgi:ABC-type spermidine/putrescine transport system, permease component II
MVKKVIAKSYLYLLLALLYAPIVLIIVFSFFNTSTFTFSEGFSFEAYKSIFTSDKTPELLSALKKHFDYRGDFKYRFDGHRRVFGNRHLLSETKASQRGRERKSAADYQQRNRNGGRAYGVFRNL